MEDVVVLRPPEWVSSVSPHQSLIHYAIQVRGWKIFTCGIIPWTKKNGITVKKFYIPEKSKESFLVLRLPSSPPPGVFYLSATIIYKALESQFKPRLHPIVNKWNYLTSMCIAETAISYLQILSGQSQYLYPFIYDTHVLYYIKYESPASNGSMATRVISRIW